MKLMIIGPREITNADYRKVSTCIIEYTNVQKVDEVISGGAKGVDSIAEYQAKLSGIPFRLFAADWNRLGKSAGYQRNREMVDYCTEALVFWNGESKGTKHSIDLLEKSGKPYTLIMLENK